MLVLAVLIAAIVLIFPTIKWYFMVPEDTKSLATGTNAEIKEYVYESASNDVAYLLSLAKASPNDKIPSNLNYLAKDKKQSVREVLASYKSEAAIFSSAEKHYREELLEIKKLKDKSLQLGLDLKGGMSILLDADVDSLTEKLNREPTQAEITKAVQDNIEILKSRVDQFGLSEPDIRLMGTDQILIELPGDNDSERINSILKGSGDLYFILVDRELTNEVNKAFQNNPQDFLNERGEIITPSFIPENKMIAGYYNTDDYGLETLTSLVALKKEGSVDGSSIQRVEATKDQLTLKPVVNFTLNSEGAKDFYKLTLENKGQAMAVVLNNRVKSVATINDAIDSNVQISGFTEKEATNLSLVLKTSSLAIDMKIASQQTVGATLGGDTVEVGLKAILIGLCLVLLFMFAYYGLSGLVANFVLLLNLFIMLSVLSAFQFTVTLISMAGLILTLGMSVDANVIIFERIKEELREGADAKDSVKVGFSKAFWTIMDSNITTIIAALVLSQLGSSSVKGFAITLAVGIVASLITALFICHFILDVFVKNRIHIGWRKIK